MSEKPFMHIFYPEHIDPPGKVEPQLSLPCAILVPDAAYDWVKDEIRGPYARVSESKPELVITLSPLHQEVLEKDKGGFAFVPEGETFLPLPDWMVRHDAYFHEEPAPEEQAAIIATFFPSAKILTILVSPQLTASECRKLASFLDRTIQDHPGTLVVAAINGTALGTSKTVNKDIIALRKLLSEGGPLLEALHGRTISSLGTPILEAIEKSTKLQGVWHLERFSLRSHHYTTLPDPLPEEEGRSAWHISGWRG